MSQSTRFPARIPKKVLIVDDHPIVRIGLERLMERHAEDFILSGQAATATEALVSAECDPPDLAIIDLSLKESSGLELIEDLHRRQPSLPILVLSMHEELRYAQRALHAGARGYVMKQEMAEQMITAMHAVLSGKIYLSDRAKDAVVEKHIGGGKEGGSSGDPWHALSAREFEVFCLIGEAEPTAQIAQRLHISPKTVETHCARIKQKLGLRNAIELHQMAYQALHGGDADGSVNRPL